MLSPGAPLFRRGGHLFMVAAAIFVGIAGAIGAVLFRLLIRTIQAIAFGGSGGIDHLLAEGLLAEAGDPLAMAGELREDRRDAGGALEAGAMQQSPGDWGFATDVDTIEFQTQHVDVVG